MVGSLAAEVLAGSVRRRGAGHHHCRGVMASASSAARKEATPCCCSRRGEVAEQVEGLGRAPTLPRQTVRPGQLIARRALARRKQAETGRDAAGIWRSTPPREPRNAASAASMTTRSTDCRYLMRSAGHVYANDSRTGVGLRF
jgi:hypothetical protein